MFEPLLHLLAQNLRSLHFFPRSGSTSEPHTATAGQMVASRTGSTPNAGLALMKGQVVGGKTLQVIPPFARMEIEGQVVFARMAAELKSGQSVWLKVEEVRPVVTLKVLSHVQETAKGSDALIPLFQSMGLKAERKAMACVQAMIQEGLPLEEEVLQRLSQWGNAFFNKQGLLAAYALKSRGLPLVRLLFEPLYRVLAEPVDWHVALTHLQEQVQTLQIPLFGAQEPAALHGDARKEAADIGGDDGAFRLDRLWRQLFLPVGQEKEGQQLLDEMQPRVLQKEMSGKAGLNLADEVMPGMLAGPAGQGPLAGTSSGSPAAASSLAALLLKILAKPDQYPPELVETSRTMSEQMLGQSLLQLPVHTESWLHYGYPLPYLPGMRGWLEMALPQERNSRAPSGRQGSLLLQLEMPALKQIWFRAFWQEKWISLDLYYQTDLSEMVRAKETARLTASLREMGFLLSRFDWHRVKEEREVPSLFAQGVDMRS